MDLREYIKWRRSVVKHFLEYPFESNENFQIGLQQVISKSKDLPPDVIEKQKQKAKVFFFSK